MTEQEFLEKAREHKEYKRLLEYSSQKKLDKAILEIKNGQGVSETYYEYTFVVHEESLSRNNPHMSDFLKDIEAVFKKYEDKGIQQGDWDSKGGSYPMALDIVRDTLKQEA